MEYAASGAFYCVVFLWTFYESISVVYAIFEKVLTKRVLLFYIEEI